MEDAGIIRSRVALLDAEKLNAGVTVFVSIKTDKHDAAWYEGFSSAVNDFPEVVEFYRMSGDIDYLLRVVVPDIAAYDRFYQRLIERVELTTSVLRFRWNRSNIRQRFRWTTPDRLSRSARLDRPEQTRGDHPPPSALGHKPAPVRTQC